MYQKDKNWDRQESKRERGSDREKEKCVRE